MDDCIVSFKNVSVFLDSTVALDDVSFDVKKGEKFFIMGSDGFR